MDWSRGPNESWSSSHMLQRQAVHAEGLSTIRLPQFLPRYGCKNIVETESTQRTPSGGIPRRQSPGPYCRRLHWYLPFSAKLVEEWQHFVPSVHERVDMAWGLRGTSSYWATLESVPERDELSRVYLTVNRTHYESFSLKCWNGTIKWILAGSSNETVKI